MSRKMIDCRKATTEIGCALTIAGREDDVLDAATAHAIVRHGRQDGPQLLEMVRAGLEDGEALGWPRADVLTTGDFHGDDRRHSTCRCTEFLRPAGPDKDRVMPLPAPDVARRLVFFRCAGLPFWEEQQAAVLPLQPHRADAMGQQGSRAATRVLTSRQRELLRMVAAGHDNIAIARRLGLSPGTVRKHLENAFARLGVSSRTAAVAKLYPDITWR
jgi:DNA-binding CsgD family transcriptional regulator